MKELITTEQANTVILALIVILPILGAAIGALNKRLLYGLKWGIGIGLLNFAMWKLYNSITDSLGLDTVKNLLVNIGMFVVIGIIGGVASVMIGRRSSKPATDGGNSDDGGAGELAAVGGPSLRGPGAARTVEEADEPPRDPG